MKPFPTMFAVALIFAISSSDTPSIGFTSRVHAEEDIIPTTINRPSTLMLYRSICSERSYISKKCRLKTAALIADMDKAHLSQLAYGDVVFYHSNDQLHQWVDNFTTQCPRRTPMGERMILYALHLQIEMLDRMLWQKNPSIAVNFRDQRRRVRIKMENDFFFGDARDVFLFTLLDNLQKISNLQDQFVEFQKTNWNIPMNVQSLSEIERFLLTKFEFLADKAIAISY